MSNIIEVSIENFDEAMAKNILVLDFFTKTCKPCQQFLPIFTDFADKEFAGAAFGKIDAEENADIVAAFGVRAVPTVIVIKNGVEVSRKSGAISASALENLITENI